MSMSFPSKEPDDLASVMRWRIDLESHDTAGAWTPVARRVPAAFDAHRGAEFMTSDLHYPVQHTFVRIRYRPGQRIYPHMRAVYRSILGTRIFFIIGVGVPDERRRSIVLLCEEQQDVGAVK